MTPCRTRIVLVGNTVLDMDKFSSLQQTAREACISIAAFIELFGESKSCSLSSCRFEIAEVFSTELF